MEIPVYLGPGLLEQSYQITGQQQQKNKTPRNQLTAWIYLALNVLSHRTRWLLCFAVLYRWKVAHDCRHTKQPTVARPTATPIIWKNCPHSLSENTFSQYHRILQLNILCPFFLNPRRSIKMTEVTVWSHSSTGNETQYGINGCQNFHIILKHSSTTCMSNLWNAL